MKRGKWWIWVKTNECVSRVCLCALISMFRWKDLQCCWKEPAHKGRCHSARRVFLSARIPVWQDLFVESQTCTFQRGAHCPCLPGVRPDKYLKMHRSPNRQLLSHLVEGKHILSKRTAIVIIILKSWRFPKTFTQFLQSRTLTQQKLRAAVLIGQ